jgi:hypothetical protein
MRYTYEHLAACQQVVRPIPMDRQVYRARVMAFEYVNRDANLKLAMLEEEAQLWRAEGNYFEVYTVDAQGMFEIKVDQFRSIFAQMKRDGKSVPSGSVFDSESVTFQDIEAGRRYLVGFVFIPKTARDMGPFLRTTFAADGAHLKVLGNRTKAQLEGEGWAGCSEGCVGLY